MKTIDIALKDMRQSYRSLSGIMFMFVIPILVTVLFYFMFGGANAEEDSFSLPQTDVLLVNLDAGQMPDADFAANGNFDMGQASSMGGLLAQILQGEEFADLLAVTAVSDPNAARAVVDNQEADIAIILPANFTDALMRPGETAVIELYQDPTLTIGPAIVNSIINQFADGFAAAKIGGGAAMQQLAQSGVPIDAALTQEVMVELAQAAINQSDQSTSRLNVQAPTGVDENASLLSQILGQIMGGMMIFFAFFTGSAMLQSILIEEEKGTLSRLFTTPTPVRAILNGKVLAALLTLLVQVVVLMLFGRLAFKIDWGTAVPVTLAVIGVILLSAATGLFIVSLLQNTRQAGAVYGGALTLTGMIGLISIFTGGQASPAIRVVTLFVPQGWAVQGLQIAMNGGGAGELLPTLAGAAVWVIVFVGIGQYRLKRRFA